MKHFLTILTFFAADQCPSLCNHEERLGLLEFAVKQTESTQLLQKENSELKAKIVELSSNKDTEKCRNEMDLWQRMTDGGLQASKLVMTLPKTPFIDVD